jgi:hypothetical protein
MLFHISLYIGLGLLMVTAMAVMILKIGRLLGDCPQSGRAARAAAVTIACGYGMIGFGGVALIGSAIPLLDIGAIGILPSLGLAALCLGLGFSNAVATLRAVVREAGPQPQPAPSTPDSMASAA